MAEHKVIGYIAATVKHRYFAHANALLVTSDEATMRRCIISQTQKSSALKSYEIRKIRYKDLEAWLDNGVSTAFDETSYNRFAESALENARKLKHKKFPRNPKESVSGIPIVILRPKK